MGQLIFKSAADEKATWYFADAYYSSEGRGAYQYKWPNPSFPHSVTISDDDIDNVLRIKIRKWIELNLRETVICNVVDLSYKKHYGLKRTWENSHDIKNWWTVFYFEDEHSAMLFRLAFLDTIKPMTKHHPKYPEDEPWAKLNMKERMEYFENLGITSDYTMS